ncbi:MAG: zinc ABC transporter substrate-binding protein [Clostridia bacterium]|nr:zinc ABC transporter substrate-binding protein [Clostridia bacterium]
MKKLFVLFLCFCLLLPALGGCGEAAPREGGKLRVVATIFPLYDWLREIAGDRAEITLLMDSGVDLHSYQPRAKDVAEITSCDLLVYVGGESDEWIGRALAAAGKKPRTVPLLDALGDAAKEEETAEGMQSSGEEENGETEYDEHIWLSLSNARSLCGVLADRLAALDPEGAELYRANVDAYTEKLRELDGAYRAAAAGAKQKTLLFADRFPFRYLADDYGLSYFAAFSGCSAETEASFETVIFLAKKADELGLGAILQIETSDGSLARTVRDNTKTKDQKILTLNSLQSVTADDVKNGATYLSLMEENLEVLKAALGSAEDAR